jgi:NAD(P)-dependent dehydrogenase (short-subunit alcohol dehydrogenase family)
MPIALITGSTRGIGLATAQALAGAGHIVIIAGRNEAAVQTVCSSPEMNGLADGVQLDVTDPDSVRAAAEHIRTKHGKLDILINNAGVLPEATDPEPHEYASADMFRNTFETNVFGAVAVTEALLPLLRNSAAGRIVNVSSAMGSLADQCDPTSPYYAMAVPAYQCSKAALNSVTIGLSKKLAGSNVVVTSVCPGFVQTDLTPTNREQAPLTAKDAAEVIIEAALLPDGAHSGTFVDATGPVRW